METTMETNKFKRAWIWLWYNDLTRICIFIGIPLIPVGIVLLFFNVDVETIKSTLFIVYILLFGWMFFDNNYSNLRRIGMDEYRNKL